jgi:hypothetical protein
VPQLYLALTPPDAAVTEPPLQLKGFSKLSLAPGQTRRVTLPIDQRALSYWDSTRQVWRVVPGCHEVLVGQSSRDPLAQRAVVAAGGAHCGGNATMLQRRSRPRPRACVTRRALAIHLRGVRSSRVRTVTVYLNGHRQRVLRGPRSAVSVTLPGHGRAAARIRLVVRTASGRRVVVTRRYRPCGGARSR